jgi:hypothetical protein
MTPLATRAFLRLAAACCAVSSLTTLGLIFLPYAFAPIADGETARRLLDPVYMLRVWVALVHPLLVLIGAMGVFAVRAAVAPGASFTGLVFFLLWAGTEAVQQSLTLVTLNWTWRTEYLQSTTAAARDVLGQYLQAFEAVSDGLFFFILIAFIVADVAYAVATWGGDSLQRTVAVGFGLAAGLGVVSALTSFGPGVFPDALMAVLYPLIQPAARFLTGVWLWRQASTA